MDAIAPERCGVKIDESIHYAALDMPGRITDINGINAPNAG
jgi:hypothetical protein